MADVTLYGRALRYSYQRGQPVLHGVNVLLATHTVLYMLGHNGCGKTTLLELLGGVRTPQSGTVQINGTDIYRLPAHARAQRIGLVPQTHVPVFAYDVRGVVTMGRAPHLGFWSTPGRADRAIVDQALDRVGLLDLAARPYTELSGGERQLVLIARGLAQQTEVLLLDEPTAHLDPRNQRIVLETVAQLAAERRVSFVISSHNPNSALLYADQVIVIKKGCVVADGPPHEVLTEETLSQSYDMPVEVVYNQDRVARAIVPRRNSRWP